MKITELARALGETLVGHAPIVVERSVFPRHAETLVKTGAPLVFMFATDESVAIKKFAVHAVFSAVDGFLTLRTEVPIDDARYPSLTASIMAAHWYERLIHDQFGIVAEGHPDWRRLIHHENIPEHTFPLRKNFKWDAKLSRANGVYPMHAVEGKGIYEIPVGPIHAGIIEPGHFRFSVRGERILTLEGKLFFKHKGVEKLVEGKTPLEAMPFIERISGDMVVGHSLAFVQAIERICGMELSDRAKMLRVVWSELERVTQHILDVGNMGGMGTGFTFIAAQGFRMVEELRRLHEAVVGHRFLRGAIVLGGAKDVDDAAKTRVLQQLIKTEKELKGLLSIAFSNDGLMERFETTGVLSKAAASAYGARGVPARASGIPIYMRRDHPYAGYQGLSYDVISESAGDVAARFRVRAREVAESIRLIRQAFDAMPKERSAHSIVLRPGAALGVVEAWRGAVIDWVRLDESGKIDRCAISDPSFCNWPLFGEIGPGNIVPDFPLCNKSLNLSYSGNDL